MGKETVLSFIKHFKGSEDIFQYDMCYWFAVILHERFGGTIYYEQIYGHFVTRISDRLYDVSGDVTERYQDLRLIAWEEMESFDSSLHRRVIRDCVNKECFDD